MRIFSICPIYVLSTIFNEKNPNIKKITLICFCWKIHMVIAHSVFQLNENIRENTKKLFNLKLRMKGKINYIFLSNFFL